MPRDDDAQRGEAARKKLDDYFLDTGGKLLAVARSATTTPRR